MIFKKKSSKIGDDSVTDDESGLGLFGECERITITRDKLSNDSRSAKQNPTLTRTRKRSHVELSVNFT